MFDGAENEEWFSSIGVVVVTFNSARDIGACLRTLPLPALHGVVVVDNASTDGTADVVRSLDVPGVKLIASPTNRGFGGGCNLGAGRLPGAPLLLFLNPDVRVDSRALVLLAQYLDRSPRAALVAPRLSGPDGPISSSGGEASLRTELFDVVPRRFRFLARDRRCAPGSESSGPAGYVEGACMMIRASDLAAIGGFDERYFLYYEELDLAERFRSNGRTVDLHSDAVAMHEQGSSTRQQPFGARDWYFESALRYLRSRFGVAVGIIYHAIAVASWYYEFLAGALDRDAVAVRRAALRRAWRPPVERGHPS